MKYLLPSHWYLRKVRGEQREKDIFFSLESEVIEYINHRPSCYGYKHSYQRPNNNIFRFFDFFIISRWKEIEHTPIHHGKHSYNRNILYNSRRKIPNHWKSNSITSFRAAWKSIALRSWSCCEKWIIQTKREKGNNNIKNMFHHTNSYRGDK